jgi:hypothetical protein
MQHVSTKEKSQIWLAGEDNGLKESTCGPGGDAGYGFDKHAFQTV